MSEIHKHRFSPGWVTLFVVVGLIDLTLIIRWLLLGKNVSLFNPQGFISQQQHGLFVLVAILLVGAAVPVVLFLYFVAWKFRESNTKAVHKPEARDHTSLVFTIWAYPILFFFIFAAILIPATHRLEPRKAIASDVEPLTIQVVALRWKWLFLYPDQKIASVNFVQLPVNRPVIFKLTADDVSMSSFWIPNVGGQLYAMTGMVNTLNLMPDKVGNYPGSTAEINGEGFADMTFVASVSSQSDFDSWARGLQQHGDTLDMATYEKMVQPSEADSPAYFGSYDHNLYATVLTKYMGHDHGTGNSEHEDHE